MKHTALQLTAPKRIQISTSESTPPIKPGHLRLRVLYCGVCRTDAKMWKSGHRDLALPRIPGHEVAAIDDNSGQLYTIWPGQSCQSCSYCKAGRDNLCEEMKIIGFHSDGGFCDFIDVPENSLIPVNHDIDPKILCFAEPVACVMNCLRALRITKNNRVIIYGGGSVGMIAALACRELLAEVVVIEERTEKISRTASFSKCTGIPIVKQTAAGDFDAAINCCDSPIAFSQCIAKLQKGGRLGFFSGLKKNEAMNTDLLNLLHYRENVLYGTYGPRKSDMHEAAIFCTNQEKLLSLLIEEVIVPENVPSVLERVADGRTLKYIIEFTPPVPPAG